MIAFLEPFVTQGNTANINEGQKQNFSALLFGARTGFERLNSDPAASKILKSLKIDAIYETSRLGKLLSTFSTVGQAQGIWNTPPNFAEFFIFLELLRSLANLEGTCSQLLDAEKIGAPASHDGILELQVIDYDGAGISPNRIALLVSSVVKLHTDLARIHGITGDRLRFAYFDSGSDLLVALQCAKAIIESMKSLLAEWWKYIRFRSYESFEKKMDAISKSLSVMESVQTAVESKVIDEETANILKTRVLIEVDNLIGIGATLPLPVGTEKIDERKLLTDQRNVKLLGPGEPEVPSDNPQTTT